MKVSQTESDENHELRRKVVHWAIIIAGITAIVLGIVGIAILAVMGLMLLASSIGSILLGRYLLRMARNRPEWPPFNMWRNDNN